eukprot:2568180-Pyramimonas_sp.AAC.1
MPCERWALRLEWKEKGKKRRRRRRKKRSSRRRREEIQKRGHAEATVITINPAWKPTPSGRRVASSSPNYP